MKRTELSTGFVPLALTLICIGCGGGRVPVEGTITFDGKPLVGATVALQRNEGELTERSFIAETNGEGKYQLKTADGSAEGAPPGSYHVFITSVKAPPDMNEMTKLPPERVPVKWRDGSEMFEVPAGGTTEANFLITSK
jgi:hypothetical protein